MEYKNSNKLVKKANELVESRYEFDIWETRVFAKMLTLIHKDDENFKTYRIYIKEIQDDFQLSKNKDAYKRLKDAARRLMHRIVKITYATEEGKKVLETPVIIGLETLVAGKSFIDVSFHPNMKPFLLQLKSQFLMYDIRNILKLSSVHSVRIYELLKQYEKIGYRTFLVDELKDILQLSEKYPLYANFKQRVIQKAQKDLEKYTDISFEFEEIKRGRSVEKIVFQIKKNFLSRGEVKIEEQEVVLETTINQHQLVIEILKQEGIIDRQTVASILEKHSLEHVVATIKKCQSYFSKKVVKNQAGYIIEAINKGYYEVEIAEDALNVERTKKRTQKEFALAKQENKLKEIKDSFYQEYGNKVKNLREKYLNDALISSILESKKETPFYTTVLESIKNNESSKLLDAWINDYLSETYLSKIEYTFKEYLKKYYPNFLDKK